MSNTDHNAEGRKGDHIEMAFRSVVSSDELDSRFYYEPLMQAHPSEQRLETTFCGKLLRIPLWVSSMTGGTAKARLINANLARACAEFGMGMGLGSCRALLTSKDAHADFDVRDIIGPDLPLFGNLGIAQIEQLIAKKQLDLIDGLHDRLQLDGLIVHVNPLQEAFQPEGDRFAKAPLDSIAQLIADASYPIIVKEVGQGMGRSSLEALLKLPLAALDFAAAGGTNFAQLELLRNQDKTALSPLVRVGHSAVDMVSMVNELIFQLGSEVQCRQLIVSGGVRDFLDGYYLINKVQLPAVYGQASGFLRHAQGDYAQLQAHIQTQAEGLSLANAYLKIK